MSETTNQSRSMNTIIHAAFRRDLRRFDAALAALEPGGQQRASELYRAWQHYAGQLQQHHDGEEEIFFPALACVAAVTALIADLEAEHGALLAALMAADTAMQDLEAGPDAGHLKAAREAMSVFQQVLDTHLSHEERDFEPVARQHAVSPEMKAAEKAIRRRHRSDSGDFFCWLLDGAAPADAAALRRLIPAPVLHAATFVGGRTYKTRIAPVWAAR